MSDEKISAMPDAGSLQAQDQIPLVRSGSNLSTTPSRVAAYTGISSVNSSVASLSTGLFTVNSSVSSLSTGLSTAFSSVSSLSTSTSTAIASVGARGASYTPPVLSAFTYANQPPGGSATAIAGGIQLAAPSLGSGFNLNLLLEAAPSAPYTKWCRLNFNGNPSVPYSSLGLALADGSGKVLTFEFFGGIDDPEGHLFIRNYTSYTSDNSSISLTGSLPPLMGVNDDGTNLNFLTSFDGVTSFLEQSVSRTAWLSSPSQIGIFTNSFSQPIVANFSHWGPNLPGPI